MADFVVVKVWYNGELRRTTVEKSATYEDLSRKLRSMFQLDAEPFTVTYKDDEGDEVTMADSHDLEDALVHQGLNPLRISVKLGASSGTPSPAASTTFVPSPASSEKAAEKEADKTAPAPSEKAAEKDADKTAEKQPEGFTSPLEADILKQLKDLLQATKGDGPSVPPFLEPFFKAAPARIAEVMELARQAGFQAEFEPVFEHVADRFRAAAATDKDANVEVDAEVNAESKEQATGDNADSAPAAAAETQADVEKPNEEIPKPKAEEKARDPTAEAVKHVGVQCDGCGAYPIQGTRYKSLVKADYDLCQQCFTSQGTAADYNKIERPLCRPRGPHPFGGGYAWTHMRPPMHAGAVPRPASFGGRPFFEGPRYRGGCPMHRPERPNLDGKLDSRFVRDISIFDGTVMSPNADFTKIWRLRNCGTVPWPPMTHLVHVGGDQLAETDAVPLQLPEEGLAPGEEIQVAVDMKAPPVGGRYVSHWRLVAPGGPKFGHRVWALIQVVSPDDSAADVAAAHFGKETAKEEKTTDSNEEQSAPEVPQETAIAPPTPSPATEQLPEVAPEESPEELPPPPPVAVAPESHPAPVAAEDPVVIIPVHFVEESPAPSAPAAVQDVAVVEPEQVENNIQDDMVMVDDGVESPKTEVTSVGGFSFVDHPSAEGVDSKGKGPALPEEEEKVQQLVAMGFNDEDLNFMVLKEHDFNVQAAIDDLVSASDWDPMMEELEFLGFDDRNVNRRLLMKHKGSVKHVVKDLVGGMGKK